MTDENVDWSAVFADRECERENLAAVHRARDLGECRRLAAVAAETADECREFASMAMNSAHEARRSVDAASDAVAQSRDALDEYVRTARTCMRLDVGVLIAAIVMLVLTLVNFYWS